jgi:starvation-inducible outer membrane lipoprotein
MMDLKMTYHFKIFALALLLSGCSAFTDRLSEEDPLLIPPNVIDDEPGQIICVTEYPKMCDGFLTDKTIDIEE